MICASRVLNPRENNDKDFSLDGCTIVIHVSERSISPALHHDYNNIYIIVSFYKQISRIIMGKLVHYNLHVFAILATVGKLDNTFAT